MKYNTLGFALHRKCNASCKMCCFECNPKSIEELDVERVKQYILESQNVEEIKTISFTGGEPFLDFEKLLDLIKFAAQCNKQVACITNAFWAKDYDTAFHMASKLKDAGLSKMNISHDAYHKEFVSTNNVKNALYAIRDLGIPVTVGMIRTKNEDIGGIVNELGDALYASNLQVFPCYPSGGALTALTNEDFDRTLPVKHLRCIYDGNIVVTYDGTMYPCCSQFVVETGLSIGNFYELGLKEALKKIKNNALLYFIRTKEFDFFTEYAKNNIQINIPDKVTNPCELCSILFKKENLDKFLPFVLEQIKSVTLVKEVNS